MPDLSATEEPSPRAFLEALRHRVLRVTAGMRPGRQRLELAIEAFWYAALELKSTGVTLPWTAFGAAGHPQRGLLDPVRLMIRSELINSGLPRPDALAERAMLRVLEVAQAEVLAGGVDVAAREKFFTLLRADMRGAPRSDPDSDAPVNAAA